MSQIKAIVEVEATDGKRIVYLQKCYSVPCWIVKGMKLDLVTTDLANLTQHVSIAGQLEYKEDEFQEEIDRWIEDGWVVDSEDSYL